MGGVPPLAGPIPGAFDLARYLGEHPELGVGHPSKTTVGKILQAADIRLERL